MSFPNFSEFVIIGAGIHGLSTAWRLAKKINGEIINADSMQVYKDLKILSARPLKKNYQKMYKEL